jgi:hypothetical protein
MLSKVLGFEHKRQIIDIIKGIFLDFLSRIQAKMQKLHQIAYGIKFA